MATARLLEAISIEPEFEVGGFKLSRPIEGWQYVIVAQETLPGRSRVRIFGANETGQIGVTLSELGEVVVREIPGDMTCAEVLEGFGYDVLVE